MASFNSAIKEASEKGESIQNPLKEDEEDFLKELPSIVVVVDEFADMMMLVGKKVAGKIGENVKVRRFTRYTLGEGIEVQEKGTNPLVRSMGESRGIGQTGVRSSLGHSGIGLGFGEPTTVFPPRTNWFGPNACRPSTRTTVDLRLPLIGSSQGRLNLSLTGFPKLEGERGLSLHRSECKVVRPLVPPMSPVRRDVLTN